VNVCWVISKLSTIRHSFDLPQHYPFNVLQIINSIVWVQNILGYNLNHVLECHSSESWRHFLIIVLIIRLLIICFESTSYHRKKPSTQGIQINLVDIHDSEIMAHNSVGKSLSKIARLFQYRITMRGNFISYQNTVIHIGSTTWACVRYQNNKSLTAPNPILAMLSSISWVVIAYTLCRTPGCIMHISKKSELDFFRPSINTSDKIIDFKENYRF
jgi:hypothetical protein